MNKMINVVYLVLVIKIGYSGGPISIPQANMKQCQINKAEYSKDKDNAAQRSYCIVGVK